MLAGLTAFYAVGLRQEAKAEESVKALAQMMKTVARVRRDGQALEIDATELVPGDVVLMEAGNQVRPTAGSGWPRPWRSRRPPSPGEPSGAKDTGRPPGTTCR